MKPNLPRVKYSDFFRPLNLSALEWEKSKFYLDGEEYTYAGHHHESLIWLRRKNRVLTFKQAEVLERLRLAS